MSVLLALAGIWGCTPQFGVPPLAAASGVGTTATSELVIRLNLVSRSRLLAVVSDVEQVVVQVAPQNFSAGPMSQGTYPSIVKTVDKTAWATGSVSLSFQVQPSVTWAVRLTALDAAGRAIGSAHRSVILGPGVPVHLPIDLQLDAAPSTASPSPTGGLTTSIDFGLPLPTVGTVSRITAPSTVSGKFFGFDPAGAPCVSFQLSNQRGYYKLTANGAIAQTVTFNPAPSGAYHYMMDAAGQAWVLVPGFIVKYGTNGSELARYPISALGSSFGVFDPAGNVWVRDAERRMMSFSPTGTVLATYNAQRPVSQMVFDAVSGHGWSLEETQLVKVSPSGQRLLTVDFPPSGKAFQTDQLRAVAVDRDGNAWVWRTSDELFKVSPTGQILGRYPGPVNVGHLRVDNAGRLWAVSLTNSDANLTQYNTSGEAIGSNGTGFGATEAHVDALGNLWLRGFDTRTFVRLTP